MGVIHSEDNVPELADIEPHPDTAVEVDLTINDGSLQQINDTSHSEGNENIATRIIQTPEPFSCHECANCTSKSDYRPRVCGSGITMCYVGLISIIFSFYLLFLVR